MSKYLSTYIHTHYVVTLNDTLSLGDRLSGCSVGGPRVRVLALAPTCTCVIWLVDDSGDCGDGIVVVVTMLTAAATKTSSDCMATGSDVVHVSSVDGSTSVVSYVDGWTAGRESVCIYSLLLSGVWHAGEGGGHTGCGIVASFCKSGGHTGCGIVVSLCKLDGHTGCGIVVSLCKLGDITVLIVVFSITMSSEFILYGLLHKNTCNLK